MALKRVLLAGVLAVLLPCGATVAADNPPMEPVCAGPFQPTWESLRKYQCPEWFRDAKFGIWAHWDAQCVPEAGSWYARNMYVADNSDNKYHKEHYGNPSEFGFKDIDNLWKCAKWEPARLIELYKKAGAKYFFALANHHDNFDCFDSKYQPWNSTKIGPKRDIVNEWAQATRAAGLRFGISVHSARAWSWFETAQAGDGLLTKADGKGKWWEGLDPQDLYAQNHTPGAKPSRAYCVNFYNRVADMVNKYQPDVLYFDDGVLPLKGSGDEYGLKIAAHLYNSSMKAHNGQNEAVMNTKHLSDTQRKAILLDIERGKLDTIDPLPWQTDTCIGGWFYNHNVFEKKKYKSAQTVLHMLIDIVSKNGNLMLSVPLRADGSIDEQETAVLEGLAKWMPVNGECIFGTRPFTVYGEGPSQETEKNRFGGIKDAPTKPYTSQDIRFTTNGTTLYAIVLAWPEDGKVTIKTLATGSEHYQGDIADVKLLGTDAKLTWDRTAAALVVTLPAQKPCDAAYALKITAAH